MTTNEFLTLLSGAGEDKSLVFYPKPTERIPAGYHITEVMTMRIDSVDCGGRFSDDVRTVVQLWNGKQAGAEFLSTAKAASIFARVNKTKPLESQSELFIEWGDETTPTSTYAIDSIVSGADELAVNLFIPRTQCKPATEARLKRGTAQLSGCCS